VVRELDVHWTRCTWPWSRASGARLASTKANFWKIDEKHTHEHGWKNNQFACLCTVSQTPTPAHHDGACFRSNRRNDDGDCSSGGTGSVSASRLALGTSASYAAGGGGGSPASARRAATVWRHSRSSSGGSRGELSTLPSVASSSDHFDLVSFCCRGGAL